MTKPPSLNSLGIAKAPADTRVVVAMSGGVDSSVVAALLKRDGYDVVGITLQLYDHGAASHRKGACCAGRDIHDARNVATKLGIPHYVLDYESRFREKVITPFMEAYAAGETPIPCVSCNQHVKFADLLDTALDLGADVLATGHYVVSKPAGNARRGLFRAADANRDQSYFLYATTRDQLDILRFPLGDRPKQSVRELAREFGLDVAEKADSQDICFVPTGRYTDLIRKLQPDAVTPGDIVHVDGRVLGRHEGIVNFTVGQRKGLGLADNPLSGNEPLFVVQLDPERNRVLVGPRAALATAKLDLRDVNWIGSDNLDEIGPEGLEVAVRLRSTRPPVPARLYADGARVWVALAASEEGVSPGQACVIYQSEEADAQVLGGGTIQRTKPQVATVTTSAAIFEVVAG